MPVPAPEMSRASPAFCYRISDSMRAQSIALSLALLLAAAVAQSPAPSPQASAQPTDATASGPPLLTAAQDHQRMQDLLHITAMRPGVKQDGTGPNPVNWDESKANPWPKLPDPLMLNDGKRVTSAAMWWSKRRPELMEI